MVSQGPIFEFDEDSLQECLSWWKDKLMLNDWNIIATLSSIHNMESTDSCGENRFLHSKKQAMIRIVNKYDFPSNEFEIYCAEQILVHELLHCIYNQSIYDDEPTGRFIDMMEHQQLEMMSRSLIAVKYNCSIYFNWKDKNV